MSSKEHPEYYPPQDTLRSQPEAEPPGNPAGIPPTSSRRRPVSPRKEPRDTTLPEGDSDATSTKSKKTSTSEMVLDDFQWDAWKLSHRITEHTHTARWTDKEFRSAMDEVKYPECIKGSEVCNRFKAMGCHEFEAWASNLQTEKEDPFEFGLYAPAIASDWKSHLNATWREHMEAGRRRGVDNLIERAFDIQLEGAHQYCVEVHLALPCSDAHPDLYKAIADAVTIIPISLESLNTVSRVYSWSPNSRANMYHPISFAFEAKKVPFGIRHLTLYLATAQHHRRAIGLNDAPVFGAVLNASLFELYVSIWRDDQMEIFPTGYQWGFTAAENFVSCYLHLCALARYILKLHTGTIEQSEGVMKDRQINAVRHPWRRFERPPKKGSDADPNADSDSGPTKKRKLTSSPPDQGDENETLEEDCDATIVATQFVIDQVVDGKVAPFKVYHLSEVNLRALEVLEEFYNPSSSPVEAVNKWVDEVLALKRKCKCA